jgi:hypothetical protein
MAIAELLGGPNLHAIKRFLGCAGIPSGIAD